MSKHHGAIHRSPNAAANDARIRSWRAAAYAQVLGHSTAKERECMISMQQMELATDPARRRELRRASKEAFRLLEPAEQRHVSRFCDHLTYLTWIATREPEHA